MPQQEKVLSSRANFKPPKVGAPDNRQGGATREANAPDLKLG